MNADTVIFAISALVAVFGGVMMISQRNSIASVLYLIVSLVAQAVLYVQLGAMFIGAVLIIVYAGAVMVLFLFVIMLLNVRGGEDLGEAPRTVSTVTRYVVAILLIVELAFIVKSGFFPDAGPTGLVYVPASDFGSVEAVARVLFGKYLYPFELTSVLIIAAIVGAVVIARRRTTGSSGEEGRG